MPREMIQSYAILKKAAGADDHSLVGLLGVSPGASTAAFIAISVLEKCFAGELTASAWLPKLKQIIPSYGVSLIDDADVCRQIRSATATMLKVIDIQRPAASAQAAAKRA